MRLSTIVGLTARLLHAAFAWDAHDKGVDIHLLAEPTKAAMLTQEFKEKKDQVRHTIKNSILDRYGGAEHLEAPPKELLFAQTVSPHKKQTSRKLLRFSSPGEIFYISR